MGVSRARAGPDRVTKRGAASASIISQSRKGSQPAATAERLAELTEREAVTHALIAGSPFAIVAMDADCRLTEFNAAAEELSGYRRDKVLGKEMPDLLVPARERGRLTAHITTFLDTGDPGEFTGRLRVPLLRADGTERVVELIPVQVTVNGKTTFWGILRDLTEVERLDEQRAQFLAIVSHELRTPLTSIVSFSELIRGEAEGLLRSSTTGGCG